MHNVVGFADKTSVKTGNSGAALKLEDLGTGDLSIFDSSMDAVIVIDQARQIVFSNLSAQNMFGLSSKRKHSIDTVIRMENGDIFSDEAFFREEDLLRRDNSVVRAQFTVKRLDLPGHWIVFIRDVSVEVSLHQKYRAELNKLLAQTTALDRFAFVLLSAIMGFSFLAAKFSVETIPPILAASSRYLIAGVLIAGYFALWEKTGPNWRIIKQSLWISLLKRAVPLGAFSWAVKNMPSAACATIMASVPLWLALMDQLVFAKRLSRTAWLGVSIGVSSLAIVVLSSLQGHLPIFDLLLILAATILQSVGTAFTANSDENQGLLLSVEMIIGGLALALVSFSIGEWSGFAVSAVSEKSLMAFLYLVIFNLVIGQSALSWVLSTGSAAHGAAFMFVVPTVGLVVGTSLGRESLTWPSLLACFFLVVGAYLIRRGKSTGS